MTSRDKALKLALEIVHGDEPYPTGNSPHTRLSCAKILARALIESEEECKNLRASVEVWRRALEDGIRREEVRDA